MESPRSRFDVLPAGSGGAYPAKVSALLEDLVKLGPAKREGERTSARKKCLDVYTLPAYKGAMFTFIESSIFSRELANYLADDEFCQGDEREVLI